MIEAEDVSADEQKELWRRATAEGDPAAADRLARAVARWVSRKAMELAISNGLEADDLEAVAWSRFMYAVRSYKPEVGSFLNYFACSAGREMVEVATKERLRRLKTVQLSCNGIDDGSSHDVPAPADVRTAELLAVEYALGQLWEVERRVLCDRLGVYGRVKSAAQVAAELDATEAQVQTLFRRAYARVRALLKERDVGE
ncbi:sigma factor [Fimbriiglobus ruber]|uniref:RNA polymerase sigma-70 region 2 domain-containing protein n=1 Tax=Fimbriiglobus ruber TaxID=1908690 RepID=A0A225EBU5_9BACT|nr:sigma factor [Fimbriiglobus ruber]OWK45827.1 hypothetical protein FRUB_02158 [Fimbriiglobus ruber]